MVEMIVNRKGVLFAYILRISWVFFIMMVMCSSLVMYLSYYIVSCYIQLVSLDLKQSFRQPVEEDSLQTREIDK